MYRIPAACGRTNGTSVKVAAAGAIGYVEEPEKHFPVAAFFFLREDVMKIVTSSLECVMPYTFNIPLMGEQGTVRNNQFFTSC